MLGKVKGAMPPDVPVICMTKGIETGTLQMMSEVMVDVLGPDRPLAYLSGPSFAMEIAQGLATAVTVASTDRDLGYDTMSMLTLTLTLTLPLPLPLTLTLPLSLTLTCAQRQLSPAAQLPSAAPLPPPIETPTIG